MKTNMLLFSMMICAAASAQSSISATSSSKTDLSVKKTQVSANGHAKTSLEASGKNNKFSGETSLRDEAGIDGQATGNHAKIAASHTRKQADRKAGKAISATQKEKLALTATGSKTDAGGQATSASLSKSGVKSSETVNGSAQGKAKATIKPRPVKLNTQIKTMTAVRIR